MELDRGWPMIVTQSLTIKLVFKTEKYPSYFRTILNLSNIGLFDTPIHLYGVYRL